MCWDNNPKKSTTQWLEKKKTISSFGIENHKLEKDKFIYSDRFEGLADLNDHADSICMVI